MKKLNYTQATETLGNSATLPFSSHKQNLFLLKCLFPGISQMACTIQFYYELK